MRPDWVRPGDLTYLQLLLYQRQTTGFDRFRQKLGMQIHHEKRRLITEGRTSLEVETLCARVGIRKCSGCGRTMPTFKLELR